ncbi:MAG TPA: hypothetical protein VNM48_21585 [Chloroflexota bacterium]|nr:hypothetical protein [Chloroflexota bacterium]
MLGRKNNFVALTHHVEVFVRLLDGREYRFPCLRESEKPPKRLPAVEDLPEFQTFELRV